MPQLLRKRLIAMALESTYGTDPTVAGTDALLVRDLNITPQQSDVVSRDLVRPYLGASEQLLANTRVQCTFSVELVGSGTVATAPAYGKALKACGMTETIVASTSVAYKPNSDTAPNSLTIYYAVDGVLHKVTGARGTWVLNGTVGQIPTIDFTFTGIYNAVVADASPLTPTYANQAKPQIFKNGTTTAFQFLSYSGALQTFSLDIGNNLVYRELVGGTKEVLLTDRRANGSITIEAPTLASKDYFAAALVETLGNATFQHGQTAGNIVTVSSTKIDIGDVSYADQDGIAMLTMPFTAVPSDASSGEFLLTYT